MDMPHRPMMTTGARIIRGMRRIGLALGSIIFAAGTILSLGRIGETSTGSAVDAALPGIGVSLAYGLVALALCWGLGWIIAGFTSD